MSLAECWLTNVWKGEDVKPNQKPEPRKGHKDGPPEVMAISRQGQVFKPHEQGFILSLAFGLPMMERLKKALENENALAQFGIKKTGANGLFTTFLSAGLQNHEATFVRRKEKLEAKAAGKVPPPKRRADRLRALKERLDYALGWVEQVRTLMKSLDAGDVEPIRKWAQKTMSENEARAAALRQEIEKREAASESPSYKANVKGQGSEKLTNL